ncbi:hypothetical protein AB1Y20_006202 [Prymnesium parvum]|uniref:Cyclin N-terminal domain-containing protein n=1 Tax=Prymnesium parvum TaxID=97485 RepID=A0AB34J4G3_PRYPA
MATIWAAASSLLDARLLFKKPTSKKKTPSFSERRPSTINTAHDKIMRRASTFKVNSSWADSTTTRVELLASFAMILCQHAKKCVKAKPYALHTIISGFREDESLRMFDESTRPVHACPNQLSPETALHFLATLTFVLDLEDVVIVLALILLERLGVERLKTLLGTNYWRNTVVAAFVIASKSWYDEALWLADVKYALETHRLYIDDLPKKETAFIKFIKYDVTMTRTVYTNFLLSMTALRLDPEAQSLIAKGMASPGLMALCKKPSERLNC